MSAKSIVSYGKARLRPATVPVNCDEASKSRVPAAPEAKVTFTDDGPNNSACCVPVMVMLVAVVVVESTCKWRSARGAGKVRRVAG